MCFNVIYESFYCLHVPDNRFILFSSIPLIFTSNSSEYWNQDLMPASNFVGLMQLPSALHVTFCLHRLKHLRYKLNLNDLQSAVGKIWTVFWSPSVITC